MNWLGFWRGVLWGGRGKFGEGDDEVKSRFVRSDCGIVWHRFLYEPWHNSVTLVVDCAVICSSLFDSPLPQWSLFSYHRNSLFSVEQFSPRSYRGRCLIITSSHNITRTPKSKHLI